MKPQILPPRTRPSRTGVWSPPRAGAYSPAAASGLENTYSAAFDGSDDYISTTSADDTLATKSYSFWAKSTDTGVNPVFEHGGYNIGAFHFNWSTNRALLHLGDVYRYFNDSSSQDDGNWHHHVVYIEHDDISNCKWYVDGVLQSVQSTTPSGTAAAYTAGITVGRGGGNYFDGSLDEFAVFDGELSPADCLEIFTGGPKDLTRHSPEHWWRMGDDNAGTGTIVSDVAATDGEALHLPGIASNFASVPDASDLDGQTNFTLEVKGLTVADWTPSAAQGLASKWTGTGNQRAWQLRLNTDGKLILYLSYDGAATITSTSSVATGLAAGATADIMAMRNGVDIRFYVNGVQLGDDVTVATTALFNSSESLKMGMGYGTSGTPLAGSIQRMRVWNSAVTKPANPTETPVLDADFTLRNTGTTSFTAASGQVVTITTSAIATPAAIRSATDGFLVNGASFTTAAP